MTTAVDTPKILDATGRPFEVEDRSGEVDAVKMWSSLNSYMQALTGSRLSPGIRARDPLSNHAWVFASAMCAAIAASQAPFTVFRETADTLEQRAVQAKAAGRTFQRRYGNKRRALDRHIAKSSSYRVLQRAAEPDYDHPLTDLFRRPNPFQQGSDLFSYTILWLMARGECHWILTDDEGRPDAFKPTRLWPVGPDSMKPMLSGGTHGELEGWWFTAPHYMRDGGTGIEVPLSLNEAVTFKFPNPNDPIRGMSRLTAAAMAVETDMMIATLNRSTMSNSGRPEGIFHSDEKYSAKQLKELADMYRESHAGVARRGSPAFMPGGFQFQPISMSPADMEYANQKGMNREEVLAVMGTPPSVVGLTAAANWATAKVWEEGYWSKTIMPMLRIIESTLDGTIFFDQADDVFGMFDVAQVEALRAGVQEKINAASALCKNELHMPPRVAFGVVGLEVPEYLGDDVCLVPALATPLPQILAPEPAPVAPETTPAVEPEGAERSASPRPIKRDNTRRWEQFAEVEDRLEPRFKRSYRSWIRDEQQQTLARFDAEAKTRSFLTRETIDLDLSRILPDPTESANALKLLARPQYSALLQETYAFSLDDFGIPTFELDHPKLVEYLTKREDKFIRTTPVTVRRNLTQTLTMGIERGETIQQLRTRVAEAYDLSASHHRVLTVARTETAGFMNGARDEMFGLQGFEMLDWITAGDEHTRDTHTLYGASGSQARGFNYLELSGKTGSLTHPGDGEGPPEEVINCRCLMVPA